MSAADIRDGYDVAIVGAGPAGLAAATLCAKAGLSTVLFDEQTSAGGQIYRAITETPVKSRSVLGESYWRGADLVAAFQASGAQYVADATVWSVSREREIGVSVAGSSRLTSVRRLILCTGALERPFPIPGWTLPGVMTAGAAQILLKSSGLIASGRTVLAGCGPLLWLVAWQYLNAGARIDAILDTSAAEKRRRALPYILPFLFSRYFREGVALLRAVKRKVRVISSVTSLRAIGDSQLRSVAWRRDEGVEETLPVDTLFLHQGVVPDINLANSIGIEHRWNESQLCWAPVLDADGGSAIDGIAITGDAAGIAGGEAARLRGILAAMAAVRALGGTADASEEARVRRELARCRRGRMFLDAYYRPAQFFRQPSGDTIVCRCEEITARQITDTVALGCTGPNQMKAFLRCGMGPCQGRLCGLTVTELIAQARGVPPQEVGCFRLRAPVKPITMAQLAALPKTEAAVKAVVRI